MICLYLVLMWQMSHAMFTVCAQVGQAVIASASKCRQDVVYPIQHFPLPLYTCCRHTGDNGMGFIFFRWHVIHVPDAQCETFEKAQGWQTSDIIRKHNSTSLRSPGMFLFSQIKQEYMNSYQVFLCLVSLFQQIFPSALKTLYFFKLSDDLGFLVVVDTMGLQQITYCGMESRTFK